ncbi:MAG: hypothetical protein AB1394_17025 [Bacteroidota bacterium]
MIDVIQLKNNVIVPVLEKLELYSESAVNLLLGTCAQESKLGTYLVQIKGPALGFYQMEPATYADLWTNYLDNRPYMRKKILEICGYCDKPSPERMIDDLRLSTIMSRIHYLRVPKPLPAANDIEGLGLYWKIYYNTKNGKGTVPEFVRNYREYVA